MAAQTLVAAQGLPDVVFANAGASIGTLTEAAEDEQLFREVLETNVIGVMNTFQPYVAAMRERGHGILVGIASVAGYRGLPGAAAYSASKAAAAIAGIVARRKSYAVIPWQMALVARLMYVLPRPLYDAIAARAGRKPRRGD